MAQDLDIALDPVTHDLSIVDGDLVLTSDLAQAIRISLLLFKGEWFIDQAAGVPYLSEAVFGKNPDLDLAAAYFRDAITSVEGVAELIALDLSLDPATRTLTVTWEATSSDGTTVNGSEVI